MNKRAPRLPLESLDNPLAKLIPADLPISQMPDQGWLRAIRNAIGVSQQKLATRLGISRQAYAQLETGEKNGTISMGSLQRAAATMDCDLVYFLVPRDSSTHSNSKQAPPHSSKRTMPESAPEPLPANVSTDLFQSGIVSLPLENDPAGKG